MWLLAALAEPLRIRRAAAWTATFQPISRHPMNLETAVAFSAVAGIAVVSPGPAILLALRNGLSFGVRAVVWSSLGNIMGLFCLSAAAMLGLGLLLKSSALLFSVVKVLGAMYLFYIGLRHLLGRASLLQVEASQAAERSAYRPFRLYREALFIAAFNPKPILFFTALFPQFVDTREPLLPQFFILTGIFMLLSFITLVAYASLAARARQALQRPSFVTWVNRVFGSVFIAFGAALLALRR